MHTNEQKKAFFEPQVVDYGDLAELTAQVKTKSGGGADDFCEVISTIDD